MNVDILLCYLAFRPSQNLLGRYRKIYAYQHLQAEFIHLLSPPAYSLSESGGTGAYSSLLWAKDKT